MFELNEFMIYVMNTKPLTQENRMDILRLSSIKPEILEYVKVKMQNLTIEILGDYKGNILELMKQGVLNGWCWQTTESAIVFFNDEDYIERGNLKILENYEYYHSWICFYYQNEEYVFDPCLGILCDKSLFHKTFNIEVKGKSKSRDVREYLIEFIQNKKTKKVSELEQNIHNILRNIIGKALDEKQGETVIYGNDDVNFPMYRNNTGYKVEVENQKIKTLVAHYYMNM